MAELEEENSRLREQLVEVDQKCRELVIFNEGLKEELETVMMAGHLSKQKSA